MSDDPRSKVGNEGSQTTSTSIAPASRRPHQWVFDWPGIRFGPRDWDNFQSQEEFLVGADDERFAVIVNPESDGGEGRSSGGKGTEKSLARKKLSCWFYRIKYKYWVLQARWRAAGRKGKHGKKQRVFEPPRVDIWRTSLGALPRQVAFITLKFEKFAEVWSLLIKELGKPAYLYSTGLSESAEDDLFNLRQFQPTVAHHFVNDVADLKSLKDCIPTPTCSLVVPHQDRTTSCPLEPRKLAAYYDKDIWDGCITPEPIAIDGKYYLLFRSQVLPEALALGFEGIHDYLHRVVDRYVHHPDSQREVIVGRVARYGNEAGVSTPKKVIDHLLEREDYLEMVFAKMPAHPRNGAEMTAEWREFATALMSDLVRMFDADFLFRCLAPKYACALRLERERFEGAEVTALRKTCIDPSTTWVSRRFKFFSPNGYKFFRAKIKADEDYFQDCFAKALERASLNCGRTIVRQAIENARELALSGLPPVPIAALAMDDLYDDASQSFTLRHFQQVTREWKRFKPLPEDDIKKNESQNRPDGHVVKIPEGLIDRSAAASDSGLILDLNTKDPVQYRQALREWQIDSYDRLFTLHDLAPDFEWGLNLIPQVVREHFKKCQLATRTLRQVTFYAGTVGEHQVIESERNRMQWLAKALQQLNDEAFVMWRDTSEISADMIDRIHKRRPKLDKELKKWATLMDRSALVRSPVKSLRHRLEQLLAKRLWRKAERIQRNRIRSWQQKSP